MVIAIEHAGAQRGLLILPFGEEYRIVAEARTGAEEIEVQVHQAAVAPSDLPDSLLRYVLRTQQSVILGDASTQTESRRVTRHSPAAAGESPALRDEVEPLFTEDEYIRRRRPRAILCLPFVKQAKLVGVLYLENNLASGVFTPRRLAMLELLASQAAISLDHARLYADLIQENNDRRKAEERLQRNEISLREAQNGLAHVSRLTLMGELAASIAHEVNQPLAGMLTNANASLRWLAGGSPNLVEARDAIQRIVRDGNRASDVITRMRALIKKAPAAQEPLAINPTIQEVLVLTQPELRRNRVLLQTQFADDLPIVFGDKVQLQQVILNLVMNAIEAMNGIAEGARELQVSSQKMTETQFEPGKETVEARDASERGQSFVLIAVRDSGPGLDPAQLQRVFETFYTTKSLGMGMGLAISRSIIESHHGRLWVSSNSPRGAVFQFTLPCQPGP